MNRIESCSIREIHVTIELMCNNFNGRRRAWFRSHLTIKTTLKILQNFTDLIENFGTCEKVAECLMRQKLIEWNYFEVEKGSDSRNIVAVPLLEEKRKQSAAVCAGGRLLVNLAALYRV